MSALLHTASHADRMLQILLSATNLTHSMHTIDDATLIKEILLNPHPTHYLIYTTHSTASQNRTLES
jgi:hypothetical protein